MILIIEGCDCVGKTTFAQMLSEKTGYKIVKGSSFEISALGADGMFEHMMELLDRDNIIIDRFFYSNLIYGRLYNYPMMTFSQYEKLVTKMNSKALLIYLHTADSVIRNRMEKRGDDMIKIGDISKITSAYKKEICGVFAPAMHLSLDTSLSDFNIATAMVNEIIEQDMVKTYIRL